MVEQGKALPVRAEDAEETVPVQAVTSSSSISGEQTTLVHNEEEAFALEPLDVTAVPGRAPFFPFNFHTR